MSALSNSVSIFLSPQGSQSPSGRASSLNKRRPWRMATLISLMLLCSNGIVSGQSTLALRGAAIETVSESGRIESGTILISEGRIVDVGADVKIPVAARVIDLKGKTIIPGVVDPYYVVRVGANQSVETTNEITIGGRTFRIPNSPAATPMTYTRIIDCFDPRDERWEIATRSGITTVHLVSAGFGESVVARVDAACQGELGKDGKGKAFIALTNQSSSLDILRKGLQEEKQGETGNSSPSTADRLAALRARMGQRGGGPPPGVGATGSQQRPASASNSDQPRRPKTPQDEMWESVRKGESRLFVNVNNAATILYLDKAVGESEKSSFALVADGDDLFRTYEQLDPKKLAIVMPPRISLIPNTRDRVNVSKLLDEKGFELAFSLSLNQNEYRQSQSTPLFAIAMLVRSGLDRDKALRAFTMVPAKMLGIEKEIGSIEKGKRADLVVLDDDPFSATAQVVRVLVDGKETYENE